MLRAELKRFGLANSRGKRKYNYICQLHGSMRIKAIRSFTGKAVERFYWLKKKLHNADKNQKTKVKKQINTNS
jgi:hypothetical protein